MYHIWFFCVEERYFAIVDVIAVLTDSPNPQTYWRVMKKRLKDEGNETVTNCNALKMTAADGKVAGIVRRVLEAETGKPVITSQNVNDFRQLITDIVEDAAALPECPKGEEDNKGE